MNDSGILLSLCVPTYNRVGTLMIMLEQLVIDPDFDDEVEIVISDNCSTDDTGEQVQKIASRYKNIRYFCNEENVRDKNFYLALSRGEGRYLKLLNDYVSFKPAGLREMKEYIRRYEGREVNLFFYSRLRTPYRQSSEVLFEDVDSFVRAINNKITWLTNFGVWKANFGELDNVDTLWDTQLAQMDWTLHEVSLRKSVVVNFYKYATLNVPNKKMDYTFFVPHVVNYYNVYKAYMNRGLISPKTIDYDKYRILSHFVGSRIIQYLYLEKEVSFDLTMARNTLERYFGDIPYYRYLKLKGCFLKVLQKIGILPAVKCIRRRLSGR